MRTWIGLLEKERAIFSDELRYRHLLEEKEKAYLHELKVKAWTEPLSEEDIRRANEILDFVKDADLLAKSAA